MGLLESPLRVLLVDDSAADVEMNLRALRDLGRPLVTEVVDSGPALREVLHRFRPDVILSDFSMPGFGGEQALEIAQELTPDVPFIFVTGTIGEELATEVMKRGAVDYVLKHNLRRLQPAIERALLASAQQLERAQMQRALRASEERYRAIVETTEDWIWESDSSGRHSYSNGSVAKILGRTPEDVTGKYGLHYMAEADRRVVEAELPGLIAEKRGWTGWLTHWHHSDGSLRVLESTAQPLLDEAGEFLGYRGIDRDVTLRTEQAERIQKLARIQSVISAHSSAVLRARDARELLDLTCRVAVEQGLFMAAVIHEQTTENTLGLTSRHGDPNVIEVIERAGAASLDGADDPDPRQRPSLRAFRSGQRIINSDYASAEAPTALCVVMARIGVAAQIVLPIGSPPWAVLGLYSGTPRSFDSDELELLEQLTTQIDYAREFMAKGERLEHLAYHHPVTGWPSRAAFSELIGALLERGNHLLVMADIHRFRYFNSSRGRGFGDQLLSAVGARLQAWLPAGAVLSHPGDDAFLFAYPAPGSMDVAVAQVQSILAGCTIEPFLIDGEQVSIRMHASVLEAPMHAGTAEEIESSLNAVLAVAQARDQPVLAFTEEVRLRAANRAELERDLRGALTKGEFELFLQPKFSAAAQRLTGAEALIRWRHPERGLVSPAQFIPVLEETGLIIEVGAWVRREGLAIWRRWHDRGLSGLRLAVNVSARELRHVRFLDDCCELLASFQGQHGLDIEITESMVMDDIDKSIQVLQALRDLGCKIAIDDFGTGYSSLNYLSRLPADTLKIDQSFTSALAVSPDTLSLVTNIIGLAHSLRLSVIAEGVEEQEQAKLLRLLRCDELQGYLLGRPMPVAEFESTLLG